MFAVGADWVQLTWRRLPLGKVRIEHQRGQQLVDSDGGPGATTIDGLRPGDLAHVIVRPPDRPAVPVLVATLTPPPGPELFRFATISDLHLGTEYFGFNRGLHEHGPKEHGLHEEAPDEAHPIRCTRAAIEDALDWGAQRLLVKGDIVHWSRPHAWALAGELFSDLPVPADFVCGNHDVSSAGTVDPFAEARRYDLALHRRPTPIDLPGLRVVMFDSSIPEIDVGHWNHARGPVAQLAAETDGPVMVMTHHQPQEFTVPTYLPRGIPAPSARKFLRTVARANPKLFGTSGHTHRHRRRHVGGVDWAETGSPKDYPGTWTGYTVHEAGFMQTTRRVERPDCIRWTSYTSRAALGAWGRWSPGTLGDRCFTVLW